MDAIESVQNARVKLTHALQSRTKARRKERKIALEGLRVVRDAYLNGIRPDFILYTPTDNTADFIDTLVADGIPCDPVTEPVMRHISDTKAPQGIIGVFPTPQPTLPPNGQRFLVLDAITDPGNMGTIIRTATAAGVDAVILAPDSVDPYNPKVLRAGMGAHFRVPVLVYSWDDIRALPTNRYYLADGEAEMHYDTADWQADWALIIGSEAHGASQAARDIATHPITIPMTDDTESLNAATAAAVILFEAARQRRA